MTTREVAEAFAALCRDGRRAEAVALFWAPGARSVRARGGPFAEVRGIAAAQRRLASWTERHEVHDATIEGPYVAGDGFALIFGHDVTVRDTGRREQLREVGLYTVADGKVVEERFFA